MDERKYALQRFCMAVDLLPECLFMKCQMLFHPVPPNIANDVCRWYGASGNSINDFRLNPFDCAITFLYCTVQHCTALYCNVLYFTFFYKGTESSHFWHSNLGEHEIRNYSNI